MNNVNTPMDELLTFKQTYTLLKCHPNTLRLWDKNGTLKAIRFGKRGDRRYKREEVLNLIKDTPPQPIHTDIQPLDFFKQEFQTSIERLGRFQYLLTNLSAAHTAQDIADTVIHQGMQALSAQSGLIALLDDDGRYLKILHSVGFKKRELKPWNNIPLNAPIHLADAVRSNSVIIIESINEGKIRYPLTTKIAEASNNVAFVASPLAADAKILGVLCLSFSQPQRFSEADRLFMQSLGRQCAQALERIQSEQVLRKSEEKYRTLAAELRAIVESIGDAVYVGRIDGITLGNQAALEQLGYKTLDELNRHVGMLADEIQTRNTDTGELIPAEKQPFSRALAGEHVIQEVQINHRLTGEKRIVRTAASPVILEGKVFAAVAVNTDITERKHRESNQAFLADIINDMSRLSTFDEIMQTIGAKIGAYLKIESCLFVDVDDKHGKVTVFSAWSKEDVPSLHGETIRLSEFINEEFSDTNRSGKSVIVRDTQTDPRCKDGNYSVLGITAFVTVPFHRKGVWTNYLAVTDSKSHDWRDDEIELFRDLSNRIFPRLERVRAEEEVKQRLHQQEIVALFGQKTINTSNLPALMQEAVKLVSETLNTPFSKILQLFPEENNLLYKAGVGWKKGIVGNTTISASKDSLGGYALHRAKPIVFEDVSSEKRFKIPAVLREHNIKSGIHVIIKGEEKPYGVLGACSIERQQFSDNDTNFMQAIANILTQAIERHKAQRILLEREERYRLIVESVKDYAIFTLDINGIILSWNTGASRLFGYTQKEIIGKNFSLLFIPADQQKKLPDKELMIAKKIGKAEDDNWIQRKDASRIWVSGSTSMIQDDNGKILGFIKIVRDMSKERQVEQEKDQFVSMISHELKNPLTSILAFTQLVNKNLYEQKDKTSLKYLGRIEEQTYKISHLINNLLEQSKIRAKGFTFNDKAFVITDLINSVVDNMQTSKATHKIIFKEKAKKVITADPEKVGQVLENLISNAIKYSPDGKKIIISFSVDKRDIIIGVQDFGMGISKENMKKVFIPFFRATETQRESFPSIGLGLFISSEIVKHYGGRIWIESSEGKGSTFCFSLPYVK
jgi:PAS domain S-box-containing protein